MIYASSIIRKMIKPKQLKISKAEGYPYTMHVKDISLLNKSYDSYRESHDICSTSKTINITPHSYRRWNERVGPILSFETLLNTITILFHVFSYRVNLTNQGIGSIDNDILFTYETTESEILITTFYGRKSIQPPLNHLNSLRKYNLREHEYVNLALSPKELNKQHLPLIPKEVIAFEGSKTSYILEKYLLLGKNLPCFLCYKKDIMSKEIEKFVIDLENLQKEKIPNNVLFMLYRMGLADSVIEYFKIHNPEKLERVRNKILQKHFFESA